MPVPLGHVARQADPMRNFHTITLAAFQALPPRKTGSG